VGAWLRALASRAQCACKRARAQCACKRARSMLLHQGKHMNPTLPTCARSRGMHQGARWAAEQLNGLDPELLQQATDAAAAACSGGGPGSSSSCGAAGVGSAAGGTLQQLLPAQRADPADRHPLYMLARQQFEFKVRACVVEGCAPAARCVRSRRAGMGPRMQGARLQSARHHHPVCEEQSACSEAFRTTAAAPCSKERALPWAAGVPARRVRAAGRAGAKGAVPAQLCPVPGGREAEGVGDDACPVSHGSALMHPSSPSCKGSRRQASKCWGESTQGAGPQDPAQVQHPTPRACAQGGARGAWRHWGQPAFARQDSPRAGERPRAHRDEPGAARGGTHRVDRVAGTMDRCPHGCARRRTRMRRCLPRRPSGMHCHAVPPSGAGHDRGRAAGVGGRGQRRRLLHLPPGRGAPGQVRSRLCSGPCAGAPWDGSTGLRWCPGCDACLAHTT